LHKNYKMSRFSNALQLALQYLGWTQTAFAKQCGLPLPQINKYVRGRLAVGPGTLQTIARALPDRQRADVVAAWLRDALPDSAASSVSVLTASIVAESPEETAALANLNPDLDKALRFLIKIARDHSEIEDFMIDLARALRGKNQCINCVADSGS
jgi:transcriptional regulator with XRE-family HTH domain